MFRLRATIFHQNMGWDVEVRDGLERDRFDDEGPVYLIHTDAAGHVDASCRLLPTTGPTLISEIFSDTMPDAASLSSPAIWECTRFCVNYGAADARSLQQVVNVSSALVAELGALSIRAGIQTILGNFDALMLRIYRRIGCEVEVLGSTHRFGRPVYLGAFPISPAILNKVVSRMRPALAA